MILGIILILILLVIDQVSKYLIFFLMEENQMIPVIHNFFYIASKRNFGAAWSMFYGRSVFLIIITIIALGFFIYLFKDVDFRKKRFYSYGVTLMIAGALGNFIDRLTGHGVIDFLKFIIFGYHFPVFNFADMCLVVGVILFAVDLIFYDTHNFFHERKDEIDKGSN